MSYFGYKIVAIKPRPKLKLSEHVLMSDSVRKEFNDFLLSAFGCIETLQDGEIIHDKVNKIFYCNEHTRNEIKKEMQRREKSPFFSARYW